MPATANSIIHAREGVEGSSSGCRSKRKRKRYCTSTRFCGHVFVVPVWTTFEFRTNRILLREYCTLLSLWSESPTSFDWGFFLFLLHLSGVFLDSTGSLFIQVICCMLSKFCENQERSICAEERMQGTNWFKSPSSFHRILQEHKALLLEKKSGKPRIHISTILLCLCTKSTSKCSCSVRPNPNSIPPKK